MEFLIEGNTNDDIKKYMFHIKELSREEYEVTIFLWDVPPAILKYKHSLISGCITYAKEYYSGTISFDWQSLAYLNEQPVAIRDLVETHKYLFA